MRVGGEREEVVMITHLAVHRKPVGDVSPLCNPGRARISRRHEAFSFLEYSVTCEGCIRELMRKEEEDKWLKQQS